MLTLIAVVFTLIVLGFLTVVAFSPVNDEVWNRVMITISAIIFTVLLVIGAVLFPKVTNLMVTALVAGTLICLVGTWLQMKFLDWWDGRQAKKLHRIISKENGLSTEMKSHLHWEIDRIYGQLRKKRRL